MARYKQLTYGSLTFQTSYGGYEANSGWPLQIINESLSPTKERLSRATYGGFYKRQKSLGKLGAEGGLSFYLDPVTAGLAMRCVFQQYTNASSNGQYRYLFNVHSYDYNDYFALHPVTMEVNKNETESLYYYDLQARTLSFDLQPNSLVAAELGFIGKEFEKTTGTGSTVNCLGLFTTMQVSISIDNIAIKDMLGLRVNIDNGIEAFYTMQSTSTPYKLKRVDQPSTTLDGTMLVQNNSMWAGFTENTDKSVVINLANAAGSFKLDFPLMNIINHSDPNDSPGPFQASFTMEAFYSTDSASMLKATVVNSYQMIPMWFTLDDPVSGLLDQGYNFLM
jgi:hypothetical protein